MHVLILQKLEDTRGGMRHQRSLLREGDKRALANLRVRVLQTAQQSFLCLRRTVFPDEHGATATTRDIIAFQVVQALGDGLLLGVLGTAGAVVTPPDGVGVVVSPGLRHDGRGDSHKRA